MHSWPSYLSHMRRVSYHAGAVAWPGLSPPTILWIGQYGTVFRILILDAIYCSQSDRIRYDCKFLHQGGALHRYGPLSRQSSTAFPLSSTYCRDVLNTGLMRPRRVQLGCRAALLSLHAVIATVSAPLTAVVVRRAVVSAICRYAQPP